jgi:hypothetical protein
MLLGDTIDLMREHQSIRRSIRKGLLSQGNLDDNVGFRLVGWGTGLAG